MGTSLTEDDTDYRASEGTPLISGTATTATPSEDEVDPRDKYKWPVIILAYAIVFLVELSIGISNPAWNALLEKGICAELHPELARLLVAGDENPACKAPAVQGKLAMYRGWSYTLECIPTILLAVPYGSLSDSWGRKPVGMLSFVGLTLGMIWYEVVFYFPVPMWAYLWSFIWQFIGGGSPVGVSMMYTMLADVVHVDEM